MVNERTKQMETYTQQKQRHSKELNDFDGIFFAFSNQQFNEGMAKLGLSAENDKAKVCTLGSGGIILKERAKAFNDMFKRNDQERTESFKNDAFMLDALSYELSNHEYCITYDTEDTLDALGLKLEDIKPDILIQAKQSALEGCNF